jgi:hypothetical protein
MASQTISFATNRDELKNAQGITIGFGDKLNPLARIPSPTCGRTSP